MVVIKGRKSSNKNPPILSHEFVIQNHADIVSCIAMVFVVGLMGQMTSPWAYIFIAIHHNVSSMIPTDGTSIPSPLAYTIGWKDACAVFFYSLITIVMHAVIQEYIFDKISKKLKLSKSKLSKFNESSQLVTFYLLSAIWGIDIIIRENFALNISKLWIDYPAPMSFSLKFFFIGQIAYWIHSYPELYFQQVKREEMASRVIQATLGLIFTLAAYLLNFQQVGVCLLVLHHISLAFQHSARLMSFLNQKENPTKVAFSIANLIFFVTRLASVALAALVFFHGLGQVKDSLDLNTGTYNIPPVRYGALAVIGFFQIYLAYLVIKQITKHSRNNSATVATKVKGQKPRSKKKEASKKSGGSEEDEGSDNTGTRKSIRLRSTPKVK